MSKTNAHIGELPVGAIFRSYDTAPETWRIDGTNDAGRIVCHNLHDVRRVTDCPPAMSVFLVWDGQDRVPCSNGCGTLVTVLYDHERVNGVTCDDCFERITTA